jgi:dimethylargininase
VHGRPLALVRAPSSRLADGELTHLDRVPVDVGLARSQWERYVAALADAGFARIDVAAADALADSVFVEDAVVVFGRTAVVTRPGALSRREETPGAAAAVGPLGLALHRIVEPGTLEGGDVLKVGRRVYAGLGSRTNEEGIRQLAAIVEPLGYSVVTVPVTRVLHLKSAVTALPDGTVIGYEPLVDDPAAFDRFLAVPEETGSAVVVLSPDSVLMASSAPETSRMLETRGLRVVTVDVSEFQKLEGCVTCLSVRVR